MLEYFTNWRAWKYEQLASQFYRNERSAGHAALSKFDVPPEEQRDIEVTLSQYCEYCRVERERALKYAQFERDGSHARLRRMGIPFGPEEFPHLLAELKVHNSLMKDNLRFFLGVAKNLCATHE
jgi:hypothetical protein